LKSLGEHFVVRRRFFRSVNLAADAVRADACEGYALTPLGLSTLRRIREGMSTGHHERAWSLTGPYGVGKSAFVVLLSQLFAGEDLADPTLAQRAVSAVDPSLSRSLRTASQAAGLCPLLVTGTFGPLLPSLLSALEAAVRSHQRGANRQRMLDEIEAIRGAEGSSRDVQRRVIALVEGFAGRASARATGACSWWSTSSASAWSTPRSTTTASTRSFCCRSSPRSRRAAASDRSCWSPCCTSPSSATPATSPPSTAPSG
jgi:hypothetical protein